MDDDRIRLHAQKHMEDLGYGHYAIGTIMHVEGTDVWEVEVEAGEETLSLCLDDADGSLTDLKKQRNVRVGLAEQFSIHDGVTADVSMYFELAPKLRLGSINIDLESLELETDGDFLTAFRIPLANPCKADYSNAYRLANRFVNYLSVVVGEPIKHKRPLLNSGNAITMQPLSMAIDVARELGLNQRSFSSMPEQSSNAFYYFVKGHDAFRNNSFDQAIGWFYKIIEEDGSDAAKNTNPYATP